MRTTVGERLRRLRTRHGLSQTQLVDGLPVTSSYVSLIESGKRTPRESVLRVLADRLGCTVEYLQTGRGGEESRDLDLELRFAELALRSGDAKTARAQFDAVLRRAEELGYDDATIEALWGRSRAAKALGDLESAIEGFLDMSEIPSLPPTLSKLSVASALAHAYAESGDLRHAVEIASGGLGDHPEDAMKSEQGLRLAATLAVCYFHQGDLIRAGVLIRRVIDEAERHGSLKARAAAYWNAAVVAEARNDIKVARTYAERALALYNETDDACSIARLRLLNGIVIRQSSRDGHELAEPVLLDALRTLEDVGGVVDLAHAETELAHCALQAGRPAEAVEWAQSALRRLSGAPRLEAAHARVVLGRALFALGDYASALATISEAATALEQFDASIQAAQAWRELAEAMSLLGLIQQALDACRRAADLTGLRSRHAAPVSIDVTVDGAHP